MRLLRPRPAGRRQPAASSLAAALLLAAAALSGCHGRSLLHPFRRGPAPPFHRVTPAVAYEIQRDTPGMLIIDLRTPAEYQSITGHLPRARNIPLAELPYRLIEISGFREETLLVYCRDTPCGEEGMRLLVASGFEDAILVEGGIAGWLKAGYRTVLTVEGTEAPPLVPPAQVRPKPPAAR